MSNDDKYSLRKDGEYILGCSRCSCEVPTALFPTYEAGTVKRVEKWLCSCCANHFPGSGEPEQIAITMAQTAHWLAKQMHRPSIEKVFIVLNGECNEGGNVVGVCSTKEKAIEMALKHPTHFEGGWVQAPGGWNTWFNKCDFIAVEEHNIL